MSPARVHWRWEEQDFGFRFRAGSGPSAAEHYQAGAPGDYYVVPASDRKLSTTRANALAAAAQLPTAPRIVPNPWTDYALDWDWIVGPDGILLNYAGCLDDEELHRREDEGVARAMRFVADLLAHPEPAPLTAALVQQMHRALLGEIYPFAGAWRTVALHKGDGPTKWPLPPGGIGPQIALLERHVLGRSPLISDDNDAVFRYTAELMGEFIAIHPFREGNGRTAFILGNLVLMQNDLLPLDVYDRQRDRGRYYAACEAARIHKDYAPLAALIEQWEDAALARWEGSDGPA
ncbi:MAG: Fic family protein [Gammaproteobacteria bacterium]|nr:Fic family protein [Gammaproteobacteria bacterium]